MKKHTSFRALTRAFTCVCVALALILIAFFGATTIICYGPSPAARDLFVNTVMETSAAKFLAQMYFSEQQISTIIANNTPRTVTAVTDGSGVTTGGGDADFDLSAITVEDVKGPTFVGKMMIVNDPSRLFIQTVTTFDTYGEGELLIDMIDKAGAVAGINGGGFYDPGGNGKGGMPLGIVIQKGKLVSNMETKYSTLIGFDADNKLVVGDMSGEAAIALGVQEAVSFGPALVINGNRVPITGTGGGLNPRTAIGQRKDGAVLMLVIDGRQPHSLGASYKDVADVMMTYGAVNAANLDGGSSSMLFYNGELLNTLSSLIGPRPIPTAFLVR